MSDVSGACPAIPRLSRFLELNVRTYVTKDGKPGVWFFSLDASSMIAVRAARATFNLPYMDAKMSLARNQTASSIRYESNRTHSGEPPAQFSGTYHADGPAFHAQPETLEHWLTARYCLYSVNTKGQLFRGEIDHPLDTAKRRMCHPAEYDGDPFGFDFNRSQTAAEPIKVRAWWARRC